ncbi:hypothetical protein PT285_05940 [Lactobacillus sp. ESL0791]|uniref:hypothetical protein n=1 Tax=Lactobacillus sp. ESL0791 TaxID=2983234 RepID=UPI0023F86556|nr:hypothetical protein [Lactobacillus sp. ESL0791]MDF7638939.1 hypothetical protein [Lactobacillus sp. ESL0791]
MNYKKILLIFITFLSFLGIGSMLSNIQSREADQLLEAHGLSNNTRYLKINSKKSISSFLKYLTKTYPNKKIQLHLDSRYGKDQVLVWANHNVVTMPTESGRYFSSDDFTGQISFAVLGAEAKVTTVKTQNNQYILWGNRYYSVIGNLKHYRQIKQNKYYLTTGIMQPTAQNPLKNYRVVIDAAPKLTQKIARHYHTQVYTPLFVKKHQSRQFSVIRELLLILLFLIIAILANVLIAVINCESARQSHLRGSLLQTLLVNRGGRLILFEALLEVLAYIFLRWRAFYSQPMHLGLLLLGSWLITIASYILTSIYLKRKGDRLA